MTGGRWGLPDWREQDRGDLEAISQWLARRQEAMTADLAALVGLDTPSTSKPHLQAGLAWIEAWLRAMVGDPVRRQVCDGGALGDTVVLDYVGRGAKPVLLLCHYDTVWDTDTSTEWPFTVSGSSASGPGVFDMKAGLIQGAWALRALAELGLERAPVRLLLNGSEEVGSPLRRVIEAAAEEAAAVLVLEPSADGAVKTSRKGVGIWDIEVVGVEAHAGIDPTQGASAVHELARVIVELTAQEALDRGTSVNVGTVRGGTRSNVVAGGASAAVDVRTSCAVESERLGAVMASLRADDPRVRLTVSGGWNRPVLERSPAIAGMFELAAGLAELQGWTLTESSSGGGSDANFLSDFDVPMLDGLGPVGRGAHSRTEMVDLAAMAQRAGLTAALVHAFAGR
jgi:glutamate carboxypeptidase